MVEKQQLIVFVGVGIYDARDMYVIRIRRFCLAEYKL